MAVLKDDMNTKMATIALRLDTIETKLAQFQCTIPEPAAAVNEHPASGINEATRALLAIENEKEEIRLRARNVVISGLTPSSDCTDKQLLESFCDQHLTVKPLVLRTRRLGRDKTSPTSKLCATLDSPTAVDDLIESSHLLRKSTFQNVRNIYFNRDLTRQQAEIAYQNRREKRQKSNILPDGNLNPNASSFQPVSS